MIETTSPVAVRDANPGVTHQTPRCLICSGDAFETILSYGEPDVFEVAVGVRGDGYRRSWDRCTACGFHVSHYSRPPELIQRIYENDYRSMTSGWRDLDIEGMFEKVTALPAGKSETKSRVAWLRTTLADLRSSGLLPSPAGRQRFVDIGGANGIFAYEFQNADWQAHIVDPSAQGTFIERKAGIPYAQSFYRAGLFDRGFDLITLIYILEHCEDPLALLQAARADLLPGGALFVEVPDALAFGRRPPDNDIFNSCHLWMFDPISLGRLFEQAGFEILSFHRLLLMRGHFVHMAVARAR